MSVIAVTVVGLHFVYGLTDEDLTTVCSRYGAVQGVLIVNSGSSAFMMAPAAVARPRSVVRAEKEGEAVAKKKGIPLALLIWPLIAVGDDVNNSADESMRVHAIDAPARERTGLCTHRSTSRKSSRASRSRASRRPRCRTRTRTT